jgi:hypothetical protein
MLLAASEQWFFDFLFVRAARLYLAAVSIDQGREIGC